MIERAEKMAASKNLHQEVERMDPELDKRASEGAPGMERTRRDTQKQGYFEKKRGFEK